MKPSERIRIEIFTDPECTSSTQMMRSVSEASRHFPIECIEYRRDTQIAEFINRGVLISPATYINGILAFYGPVSTSDVIAAIYRHIAAPFHAGGSV